MSVQQNKQSETELRDNLVQILTDFNITYKHSEWTYIEKENHLVSDNTEIKNEFDTNRNDINTEQLNTITFPMHTYKFEYNHDYIEFKSDTNHDYC